MNYKQRTITNSAVHRTPDGGCLTAEPINRLQQIMQNKPNVKDAIINVSSFVTSKYAKMDTWLSVKTNPIQTQLPKGQKLMQSV